MLTKGISWPRNRMTMFFCVVERTMWYWFYQCSQKASVDHSRRRGWLWLTGSCSYSVASLASCRNLCSKLLQWLLRFFAMGSISVVLLESHPKRRCVPNHNKWTLYVGLLANGPEKCLVMRNFSDVVIRRCHKLHPSLPKYLTDQIIRLEKNSELVLGCLTCERYFKFLAHWVHLPWYWNVVVFAVFIDCFEQFCHENVYRGIKTSWDSFIVLGPQWSVFIIKATDCERCIWDVVDFSRPRHFQQSNLPISS